MNRWLLIALLGVASSAEAYMDFNGSSNYAWRNEVSISTYPYTVTFWFRTTASAATRAPFVMSSSSSATPTISFFRVIAGDGATNCGTAGRMKFFVRGSVGDAQFCHDMVINDGVWHFFAGVSPASNEHRLRVDLSEVTNATHVVFPTVDRVSLGGRFRVSADLYEDGDIRDVRVYDRALSTAELDSLYESRAVLANTDGLVYHWPLDEGSEGATVLGALVLDRSGNAKHLTAVSSPLYWADDLIVAP